MDDDDKGELSPEEIARRRDAAIRRALATPPIKAKDLKGKTPRAKKMKKARQATRKTDCS